MCWMKCCIYFYIRPDQNLTTDEDIRSIQKGTIDVLNLFHVFSLHKYHWQWDYIFAHSFAFLCLSYKKPPISDFYSL